MPAIDLEEYRWSLWDAAQAQSKALSDNTTAYYNQIVAARPAGGWSNSGASSGDSQTGSVASPNGSPIFSGSVGPGTFTSTGTTGSTGGGDGTGGVDPIP